MKHSVLKELVRQLLLHPHDREWTLQGFGMLRCYLDEDRTHRLHVWDPRYAVKNVSTIHTHPWDFTSTIVAGHVIDQRYLRTKATATVRSSTDMMEQTILCGEGGGLCDEPKRVKLMDFGAQSYYEGHSYTNEAANIHASLPDPGTVTLVERRFGKDVDHASVFWPVGQQWVSAEPAPAAAEIVEDITQFALKRWFW